MAKRASAKVALTVPSLELSRDIYGFTVRPQHLQRYREYAAIYKEEEAERSDRWEDFLQSHSEPLASHSSSDEDSSVNSGQSADQRGQETLEAGAAAGSRNQVVEKRVDGSSPRQEAWGHIRNTLWPVERALSSRFKKRSIANTSSTPGQDSIDVSTTNSATKHLTEISLKSREGSQGIHATEGSEDDSEDEFYDVERSDVPQDVGQFDNVVSSTTEGLNTPELPEELSPWKEELEALVRGGVPMAMRGELWQVFVGTKTRRTKGHYNALLTLLADGGGDSDGVGGLYACSNTSTDYKLSDSGILEKWTSQIEKDLPRTFPGHPALDDDGRNALRRLLTAYARHNPAVGYCQAMNFFAALLLLMMPEENAFWTLTGIMDDYFEGYYSEKMVEAQVDQLVFEDLVHEHFPRLVNHLDTLGVQVAWVSGPWFLSIFVNILPWESVLRVWDVLLYEGNRSMLFRSALALMELHGPAIMATKDAGDAVAMLQSVAGSTFDSSQLVLTACMGFQMVNESKLQELRKKHRPKVLASLKERSLEASPWHSSHGPIIPGLYNYDSSGTQLSANAALGSKNEKLISEEVSRQVVAPEYLHHNGVAQNGTADQNGPSSFVEGFIPNHTMSVDNGVLDEEENSVTDLVEQVKWLKIELCRVLEENRATTLRAEELETAFMELVKEDNRRLLTAKVETMEAEVLKLNQILAEKEEQEQAMVKVMLRMEQEQQLTEDARRFAEQDAAAQRHAANVLQEKYEDTVIALQAMEKRAVMAESMLEATLQYQDLGSGQVAAPKRGIVSLSTRDEEPSRWSWPRIPFSPKSVDHDTSAIGAVGSSSNKHNAGEVADEQLKWGLSKNNQIQVADPPRKQGLMSRSFSLSWREKSKERVGAQDLQPAASRATGDFESLSTSSSVSVSPQNSLDSKEPLVPFQGDSNVDPEAHAAEDTSCASGSDMSTERETRKE